MNTTKVINNPSPKHSSLQLKPVTGGGARASGQGRYPGAEGGIEPFNVGGVEAAKLGLREAQQLPGQRPRAEPQPLLKEEEATGSFAFDNLYQVQFRPKQQTGTTWLAGVKRVTQPFTNGLLPAAKAIGHPQKRQTALQGSRYFFYYPLYQAALTLDADRTPDKEPRKNSHGRSHPDWTPLGLDPYLVRLYLVSGQAALTHFFLLYSLGMIAGLPLPTGHRPLIQAKGKDDGLNGTSACQQGQHQYHHPDGIAQPEQGCAMPLTERPLAIYTLETPLFLRMYPDLFPFATVRTHHQAWIQGRFCHKIQSHESLSLFWDLFFVCHKIISFLRDALTISTRYFVVLPL
jgi:hypothetical protein